jgi:hypothetical protein
MSHHEIHSAICVIKGISGVWKPRLTTLAIWHECHPYHGKITRKHLIETRIPDARSLDPDPGCPFLGPGSVRRMPVPWRRANWYLLDPNLWQRQTLHNLYPNLCQRRTGRERFSLTYVLVYHNLYPNLWQRQTLHNFCSGPWPWPGWPEGFTCHWASSPRSPETQLKQQLMMIMIL